MIPDKEAVLHTTIEEKRKFVLDVIGENGQLFKYCKPKCPFLRHDYCWVESSHGIASYKSYRHCYLLDCDMSTAAAACSLYDFLLYSFEVLI